MKTKTTLLLISLLLALLFNLYVSYARANNGQETNQYFYLYADFPEQQVVGVFCENGDIDGFPSKAPNIFIVWCLPKQVVSPLAVDNNFIYLPTIIKHN